MWAQCVAVGEITILTFGKSQAITNLSGSERGAMVQILAWVTEWPAAHLVGCNFKFG